MNPEAIIKRILEQMKVETRIRKMEKLFNAIRLPTSWSFDLPVYFKKASFPLIATDAAGDYLVIPHCAGIPTGTPKTAGAMVWDSTNFKLYIWTGSAWKKVTLA